MSTDSSALDMILDRISHIQDSIDDLNKNSITREDMQYFNEAIAQRFDSERELTSSRFDDVAKDLENIKRQHDYDISNVKKQHKNDINDIRGVHRKTQSYNRWLVTTIFGAVIGTAIIVIFSDIWTGIRGG